MKSLRVHHNCGSLLPAAALRHALTVRGRLVGGMEGVRPPSGVGRQRARRVGQTHHCCHPRLARRHHVMGRVMNHLFIIYMAV